MIHLIRGYTKIYEELIKLNTKKPPNNPIKKWAKDLNRHLSKKDIQITNRHVKRCVMSLIIREIQIKTTRYYFTPDRIAIISKSTNKLLARMWRKGNPCALLVGIQVGAATVENNNLKN